MIANHHGNVKAYPSPVTRAQVQACEQSLGLPGYCDYLAASGLLTVVEKP